MNPPLETAMAHYYGGPRSAAWPTPMDERLAQSRPHATCAHCRQGIALAVPMVLRGTSTFHPICAAAWDRQQQASSARAATVPTIIGRLEGVAVIVGEPCEVRLPRGVEREQFQSGCFTRWLNAGCAVALCIDHDSTLRGRYTLLEEQQHELRFAFDLAAGAEEQRALSAVQAGRCRGCSIAFRPVRDRWGWNGGDVILRDDVRLLEISLCLSGSPLWCATWARAR